MNAPLHLGNMPPKSPSESAGAEVVTLLSLVHIATSFGAKIAVAFAVSRVRTHETFISFYSRMVLNFTSVNINDRKEGVSL